MITRVLYSYPLVYRDIKRVDDDYGYLYQNEDYTPLVRNTEWLSVLFPWKVYMDTMGGEYRPCTFWNIDELSKFFARRVEDEGLSDSTMRLDIDSWDEMFCEEERLAKIEKCEKMKQFEKMNNYGK